MARDLPSPPTATEKKQPKGAIIALAGLPNAGKSTLINKLLGYKHSIVSHHRHTTQRRTLGVCYQDNVQLVLCDTPGFATALPHALQRAMQMQLVETMQGVDLLLWLLRVDGPLTPPAGLLQLPHSLQTKLPLILVLTQTDRLSSGKKVLPLLQQVNNNWHSSDYLELIPISAKRGHNIDRLQSVLAQHAPHTGWLYASDFTSDQPQHFYIAEIIREKILWQTRNEVPHQLGVSIETLQETDKSVHINSLIRVEREGQKSIVLGKNGRAIKNAGSKARMELEKYYGRKVMLKLYVQVRPGWRNDCAHISEHLYGS